LDFNLIVLVVAARTEPLSLGELYTQLVSWEQRMDLLHGGSGSSANTATHGGRGGFNHGGGGRGRGRGRNRGNNNNSGGPRQNYNGDKPICQLCGKEGHIGLRCFKRFDASFIGPPEQSRSASSASYGIDTNWYTDTGATDHITGELEKLTVRDKYHGNDKVHAANGAGMRINQIGRSFVRTPNQNLVLNNVLYVP